MHYFRVDKFTTQRRNCVESIHLVFAITTYRFATAVFLLSHWWFLSMGGSFSSVKIVIPQIGNRKIIWKTFHNLIGRRNFLIPSHSLYNGEFRGKNVLGHEIPIGKKGSQVSTIERIQFFGRFFTISFSLRGEASDRTWNTSYLLIFQHNFTLREEDRGDEIKLRQWIYLTGNSNYA